MKIIKAEVYPDHINVLLDTAKDCNIKFYGVSKKKKQFGVKVIMWILQENAEGIAEYISNQLKEDEFLQQLCIPETSPFKGRK